MSIEYRLNVGHLSIDMSVKISAETELANVISDQVYVSTDTLLVDVVTDTVSLVSADMLIDTQATCRLWIKRHIGRYLANGIGRVSVNGCL